MEQQADILTMIKQSLIILFLVALSSISSCCDEGSIFPASDAYITFIDRSVGNSVFKSPYSFPKDSLKVFNSNGKKQEFRFTGSNNTILLFDLYNDQTDPDAMTQELCKAYVFQFLYSEIDTLRICYKTMKEDCNVTVFSYVHVYYKSDSTAHLGAENIILKK